MTSIQSPSPVQPVLPGAGGRVRWGQLYGSSPSLAIAAALKRYPGPVVIVTPDTESADRMAQEIGFFASDEDLPVRTLPDWETLPYDVFSPFEDIISQRLETFYRLPEQERGALIVPVTTLMQRLPPRSFVRGYSLVVEAGQRLDIDQLRRDLEASGYAHVAQVMEHGEFALRGSILDLYPMGSDQPYRIDLFDEEVETIRVFDPETQRSYDQVTSVRLLPGREYPLDEAAIRRFRHNYRQAFEGDPQASAIYRDISQHHAPAGIEYYLPLFFEEVATLFDYLPQGTLFVLDEDSSAAAERFRDHILERFEQRRHDRERPLLPPEQLFLNPEELTQRVAQGPWAELQHHELTGADGQEQANLGSATLPDLRLQPRASEPARTLQDFVAAFNGRILFAVESAGRREALVDQLKDQGLRPEIVADWPAFLQSDARLAVTVAPLAKGFRLPDADIAVITEDELFGERVRQQRRRRRPTRDEDAVVRNLADLHVGAPVVHEEHGVGRYLGLQKLAVGDGETEFLTLEYAGGDKLYVPVSSLHLVSRYTGASPEQAPQHKLGGEQWQRARRKAAEKARDVAAELLDIYARRAAREGRSFHVHSDEYAAFAAGFPFEETPDQEKAISAVLDDMAASRPMDRVVCGDVGFGKTEVAMRAAFVAVQNGRQVAVLVPTTLLAQQHLQNFRDRFADWAVRVESLSRFSSQREQRSVLADLAEGKVDIVIGTHKLLQRDVQLKDLGLVIIDEEHRFGVRHKERLKALRAEVDTLTLTATPIPRTLNMSLAGLRDLSVIATPPAQRHTIKTFVSEWNASLIQEACMREIKRGGQIYFLHNEVETIERTAAKVQELMPSARIRMAHGQMPERELEQVMLDFYHRRFSILVCTTIIESGIDVPTANTIVINRADKFGLAQLHQLRGRVGRSHHRAYAYMIAPPRKAMTGDAAKRLEAIESLEDLGVGFTLATHDLEIRGAGELLGEEQTGQIQEVGFTLYNELLERAVSALKSGRTPALEEPLEEGTEIDLGAPALLPDDYVPDIHTRLTLYKRIASAESEAALKELQVEMIDRFGLLPTQARNLFEAARLKLLVARLGVKKLDLGPEGGRLIFGAEPRIDSGKVVQLIQNKPQTYQLDGQQKLYVRQPLPEVESRVRVVEELVQTLALDEAA